MCWCKLPFGEVSSHNFYSYSFCKNASYHYWYKSRLFGGESFEWFLKNLNYICKQIKNYNCFLFACQWTCQIVNIPSTQRKIAKTYQWQNSCMCELAIGVHYMFWKHISTYHYNETNEVEKMKKSFQFKVMNLNSTNHVLREKYKEIKYIFRTLRITITG